MKNRIIGYILIIIAAISLRGASEKADTLKEERQELGISTYSTIDNAPPSLALTTMLFGGFRGVIADILWLRISYLQDMGQYFEIVQLADWITHLEPGNSAVWGYHAWNMSYNISVMMNDPEDRWRWVNNGITLLREDGLRFNPNDAELHWEIGWIFEDKIAGKNDQMHLFYKRRLAESCREYFGSVPAETPGLISKSPNKEKILQDLGMDTRIIDEINERFGTIDWRLPSAHSLYWAYKGLKTAHGRSLFLCNHMLMRSLTSLFTDGTLEYDTASAKYATSPDFTMYDTVLREHLAVYRQNSSDETIRTATVSFLTKAVFVFDRSGRTDKAASAFEQLKNVDNSITENMDEFMRLLNAAKPQGPAK